MIYEFIKTFGTDLSCIKMKLIDKTSLKSNHYWLMAIIPKLTNVKTLKLYRQEHQGQSYDFYKFLVKAMGYFQKNGGSLTSLHMNWLCDYNHYSLNELYPCLKAIPTV